MKLWEVVKALWCKHSATTKAACPFTEKTYETCLDCGATVSVMRTHA
jgi:hypothetical protein